MKLVPSRFERAHEKGWTERELCAPAGVSLAMCTVRDFPPPDPWEEFIYDVVWPFVHFNQKLAVCLLALVTIGALIVGLFGELSARERRVCGALPLVMGVAMFVAAVLVTRDSQWWAFHSEAQTTLLALAFTLAALGLLVFERRLFIADEE